MSLHDKINALNLKTDRECAIEKLVTEIRRVFNEQDTRPLLFGQEYPMFVEKPLTNDEIASINDRLLSEFGLKPEFSTYSVPTRGSSIIDQVPGVEWKPTEIHADEMSSYFRKGTKLKVYSPRGILTIDLLTGETHGLFEHCFKIHSTLEMFKLSPEMCAIIRQLTAVSPPNPAIVFSVFTLVVSVMND